MKERALLSELVRVQELKSTLGTDGPLRHYRRSLQAALSERHLLAFLLLKLISLFLKLIKDILDRPMGLQALNHLRRILLSGVKGIKLSYVLQSIAHQVKKRCVVHGILS